MVVFIAGNGRGGSWWGRIKFFAKFRQQHGGRGYQQVGQNDYEEKEEHGQKVRVKFVKLPHVCKISLEIRELFFSALLGCKYLAQDSF